MSTEGVCVTDDIHTSASIFEIKLNIFLDILIQKIYFSDNENKQIFWVILRDTLARTKSLTLTCYHTLYAAKLSSSPYEFPYPQ